MRAAPRSIIFLILAGSLTVSILFQRVSHGGFPWPIPLTRLGDAHETNSKSVDLVVTSQTSDDTSWLNGHFEEWNHVIYVTNDPLARYTVPENKGRENMVYLTYIIDHYDSLPDLIIFQHANRYQWHNDDPLYDGYRMLKRLQLPYVKQQGYVNLRCVWTLGCPVEIHPIQEEGETNANDENARAGSFYKQAFEELFPGEPVPAEVGISCCNQFAVAAETIRQRPVSDYQRYQEWLLATSLHDSLSGRIFEYMWHIIFGRGAVFCPNAADCYCKAYGLCNLACENDGVCASQYWLPRFSTMPSGWPDYGWEGQWQNATALREAQEADYAPVVTDVLD